MRHIGSTLVYVGYVRIALAYIAFESILVNIRISMGYFGSTLGVFWDYFKVYWEYFGVFYVKLDMLGVL